MANQSTLFLDATVQYNKAFPYKSESIQIVNALKGKKLLTSKFVLMIYKMTVLDCFIKFYTRYMQLNKSIAETIRFFKGFHSYEKTTSVDVIATICAAIEESESKMDPEEIEFLLKYWIKHGAISWFFNYCWKTCKI